VIHLLLDRLRRRVGGGRAVQTLRDSLRFGMAGGAVTASRLASGQVHSLEQLHSERDVENVPNLVLAQELAVPV
jgi:hypothetical protein